MDLKGHQTRDVLLLYPHMSDGVSCLYHLYQLFQEACFSARWGARRGRAGGTDCGVPRHGHTRYSYSRLFLPNV